MAEARRFAGSTASPRRVGTIGENMAAIIDGQVGEVQDALRAGIERASRQLQEELRRQVRSAGLGAGLEKAWRREVYPGSARRTFRPAALVYSKSTVLHDAFEVGPTIIPGRGGRYLAIPTRQAEALGFASTTISRKGGAVPGGQRRRVSMLDAAIKHFGVPIESRQRGGKRDRSRGALVFVTGRRGRLLLVYDPPGEGRIVPLFILVRSVRVPRRLDIAGATERAEAALGAAVDAALRAG